jgi:hypothetical protein
MTSTVDSPANDFEKPMICPHNLYDFTTHRMVMPHVTLVLVTHVTLLDLFDFEFFLGLT